jgi:hypothetical protein
MLDEEVASEAAQGAEDSTVRGRKIRSRGLRLRVEIRDPRPARKARYLLGGASSIFVVLAAGKRNLDLIRARGIILVVPGRY